MINAAVPVEAYDVSSSAVNEMTRARMTPGLWTDYPCRVRAAHWHALFDDGDARRALTWKGRFSGIVNTINYYSPEDEVLKCGNGEFQYPYQRTYAWYNQERYKGTKSSLQDATGFGRDEGGWNFNPASFVEHFHGTPGLPGSPIPPQGEWVTERAYPEETPRFSRADLMSVPFFGPFENSEICSTNFIATLGPAYRAQLLADAIPAESLVAGFSDVPIWGPGRNRNLTGDGFKIEGDASKWIHSFFIGSPYSSVHKLFSDIVKFLGE